MVFLVLASLLLSGCLSSIDNVVEDITGDDDGITMDWVAPELDLGMRARSSPMLDIYQNCVDLEEDLKRSLAEEMLVSLDQASYWHWYSWGWRGGFMVDDIAVDMDGAIAESADMGSAQGADSSAPPSSSGAGDREGQYSETNNQEEGVDEADFLKTDGYHIYMINNGKLVILGVPEFGEVTLESHMELEGSPMQMLVKDNQIVVISYVAYYQLPLDDPIREAMEADSDDSYYSYYRYQNKVKFTVIDIENRSAPEVQREIYLDGYYQTARLVGDTLRSVSHSYADLQNLKTYPDLPDDYWQMDYDNPERQDVWNESVNQTISHNLEVIDGLNILDFAPTMHERHADGTVTQMETVSSNCEEFASAGDSLGRGFTTIMTLELFGEDVEHELDHVSSAWVTTYASQDMLVLAEPANDWWWYWRNDAFEEATNIHAFDISEPGLTTYIGSGRISGTVNDQFSLSEYEGNIRVATTKDVWGRWWLEDSEDWTGPSNDVFVLAPAECMIPEGCEGESTELMQIGHVGGIAEGETIWSTRFVGDKGYLVTFENWDPLWTIDLSDPTNPQVIGELEVPGVSTYIHPLGDEHLLTIGLAGGEGGIGLDWGNTQISMFDVSNFSDPTLADALQLSPVDEEDEDYWRWNWAYSEATYEHKAFTYWEPAELLAIPLSTYRYMYSTITVDGRTYTYSGYEYVSQLVLVDVDAENGTLTTHGTIDHSDFYNDDDGYRSYWYSGDVNIRRSIFMGDYVYAFSSGGVTVTNYSSMNQSASVELPELEEDEYYWDRVYLEGEDDEGGDDRADGESSSSGGSAPSSDSTESGESEESRDEDGT